MQREIGKTKAEAHSGANSTKLPHGSQLSPGLCILLISIDLWLHQIYAVIIGYHCMKKNTEMVYFRVSVRCAEIMM